MRKKIIIHSMLVIAILLTVIGSLFIRDNASHWKSTVFVVDVYETDNPDVKKLDVTFGDKDYEIEWNNTDNRLPKIDNSSFDNVETGDILTSYYSRKEDKISLEKYDEMRLVNYAQGCFAVALVLMVAFMIGRRSLK